MNGITEFLKPNRWKIIITLGMAIGVFGLVFLLAEVFNPGGTGAGFRFISSGVYTKLYTVSQFLALPGILVLYSVLGGIAREMGVYFPRLVEWPVVIIVNLIFYYLLSCFIYFIFAKVKGLAIRK